MPKNIGVVYPLNVSSDGKNLEYLAIEPITGVRYTVTVCPVLHLVEMIRNADDNSTLIKLKFHNGINYTEFTVPFDKITNKDFIGILMKNSLIVEDIYAPELCSYVIELVKNFPKSNVQYIHSSLGYHHEEIFGDRTYFADKAYNSSIQSTLINNTNGLFGPHGSFKNYQAMIKSEVLPHPNLQLAFVLGFVAPIVPLLAHKTATDVIISNFSGLSSTGKTTSLSLMASVWGSGAITNRGIIKTFYATNNSLVNQLSNNMGFPVIFDDYESGNETAYGLTNLIYQIASGESKGRSEADGSNRPTFNWKTFVSLSGESSIFERAVRKQGLHGRVIEFNDFEWTVSKANAEKISSTSRTDYGFYGPMFVEKLASISIYDLEKRFDEAYRVISSKISSSNGIESRVTNKMAYIYLTAQLVKELLDISINLDVILDLLVKNELASRASRDVYSEALDVIRELITKNLSSIQTARHVDGEFSGRLIGKVDVNSHTGWTEVSLLTSVVDAELVKRGFNDRLKILKRFADDGYLERDKDRLFKKVTVGFLKQKCYKFIFKDGQITSDRQIVYSDMEPPVVNTYYDDEEAINETFRD